MLPRSPAEAPPPPTSVEASKSSSYTTTSSFSSLSIPPLRDSAVPPKVIDVDVEGSETITSSTSASAMMTTKSMASSTAANTPNERSNGLVPNSNADQSSASRGATSSAERHAPHPPTSNPSNLSSAPSLVQPPLPSFPILPSLSNASALPAQRETLALLQLLNQVGSTPGGVFQLNALAQATTPALPYHLRNPLQPFSTAPGAMAHASLASMFSFATSPAASTLLPPSTTPSAYLPMSTTPSNSTTQVSGERYKLCSLLKNAQGYQLYRAQDLAVTTPPNPSAPPPAGAESYGFVTVKAFDATLTQVAAKEGEITAKMNATEQVYGWPTKHILRLLNQFRVEGRHCLVFESVGPSLEQVLSSAIVQYQEAQMIAKQLVQTLVMLTISGLIHGDICPENIFFIFQELSNQISVRLGGFAKAVPRPGSVDRSLYSNTNLRYCAPEVLLRGELTAASDWWSFGCVIFETLTGAPLFSGSSAEELMKEIPLVIGSSAVTHAGLPGVIAPLLAPRLGNTSLFDPIVRLLDGLLQLDPERRLNPLSILSHSFFAFTEAEMIEVASKLDLPRRLEATLSQSLPSLTSLLSTALATGLLSSSAPGVIPPVAPVASSPNSYLHSGYPHPTTISFPAAIRSPAVPAAHLTFSNLTVSPRPFPQSPPSSRPSVPTAKAFFEKKKEKFVCDICGYTCQHLSKLKTHKRVHTGEKPFLCDVCGYAFSQIGNLNTHKRKHLGEKKSFHCDLCNTVFSDSAALRRHRKSHDEGEEADDSKKSSPATPATSTSTATAERKTNGKSRDSSSEPEDVQAGEETDKAVKEGEDEDAKLERSPRRRKLNPSATTTTTSSTETTSSSASETTK